MARDWSISTPLANWQSIAWIGSSQGWLLGRFPLIKGNDRGADLEMKLYYRDRVPLYGYLIDWHRIGSSGTGLVLLARDWSISIPLSIWHSIGWIVSSQGWLSH